MNKKFVVFDAEGNILRTGECPADEVALQQGVGEKLIEADASCGKDAVDPVTKKVIKGGAKPVAPPQPVLPQGPPRLSTEAKLDMLWQAMDAGAFPKAEPFYSAIKAEKKPVK